MKRALPALLAAVALAAAACTASSATGGGSSSPSGGALPSQGRIAWQKCSNAGQRQLCATLTVPLDYAHPTGRTIKLALTEVPATAPKSQQLGILVVNPGGPGASGTGIAAFVASGLEPSVSRRYDIIGFDPRGVGASVPALHCEPNFFAAERPDYIPKNAAAENVLKAHAQAYAQGCEQRFGWFLPYLTTVNVAKDLDQIRAATGQAKLNYFGYSYGTYLGQVYATLFPHQVGRMVLDSTVDPTGAWYQDNIEQDYAFQARLNAFFTWTARYNRVYRLGSTAAQVRRDWYVVRARLATTPLADPGGPNIGPAEYDDTFSAGAYDNSSWPGLAAGLAQYVEMHQAVGLTGMFNQIGKQDENSFAVYNAVECADVAWPRSWARWNSDTSRVYTTAPFLAWDNAWYNAACAYWPVHGPAKPLRIGAAGLPGILMLQGTLDPATPYAGAQNAHRLLPSARMVVVVNGGNHGQSLSFPPNTCVDGYLNSYLATGALPNAPGMVNATCPALPDPAPAG